MGTFVGDVNRGGSCNVMDIRFNPHGNGTHTECVGHISKEPYRIHECLKHYFFFARLITVLPEQSNGDRIIFPGQVSPALQPSPPQALAIRTLPNDASKISRNYSGTNPPYFHPEVMDLLRVNGVKHVLTDLPSVDKEEDEGKLEAHHRFWNYPHATETDSTITELIFVPDEIADGEYFMMIAVPGIENDANFSKILLFNFI